ncbi:isopeptide-forming domain-containing fimbrial protein [Microbacterium sp. X-17]|uniref:isopeptide-forming domain-containing fimbrial protein n=1 Tax=Microbacterium sp. X-17 TaxID=3144404 RepID=UPI0031F53CB5
MSSALGAPLRSSRRAARFRAQKKRARLISLILAPAIVLSTIGLSVWGATTAASAAAIPAPTVSIALEQTGGKYGDADPKPFILAGEDATFDVGVKNSSSTQNGYNTSLTLTVPNGIGFVSSGGMGTPIVYASGDTLPNSAKTPPLATVPAGFQLWVFMDVADLPATAAYTSTLTVRPDAAVFPVGANPAFGLTGYVSSDPTLVPMFDGSTGVGGVPALNDTSSGTASTTAPVHALRLTKTEPSPEIELLRGVHDNPTTYTLTVENTPEGATNGVTVVDYLPAGLEFLGCGTVENTQNSPLLYTSGGALGGSREYPGAGPLGTAGDPGDCLTPATVETVDSGLPAGLAAGVYTKVTWNLPSLTNTSSNVGINGVPQSVPGTAGTAGAYVIKYRAAVALFENTMNFVTTAGGPPNTTGQQAANLNNNNGPSTRQGLGPVPPSIHPGDGKPYTNTATVAGTYAGPRAAGASASVSDTDTETIQAMDLRILKSVDTHGTAPDSFVTNGLATFTLDLATSEYTSAGGMTVTDTIPNGLCPALPSNVPVSGDPFPAECQFPVTGTGAAPTLTGATADGISFDAASGKFTLTMTVDPNTMAAEATHRIQYTVLMRPQYQTNLPWQGNTTSGDTLTNHVELTGTTHSIANLAGVTNGSGTPASGDQSVWDDSSAGIKSNFSGIQKQVLPRGSVVPSGSPSAATSCAVDPGAPWAQNQTDPTDAAFVPGDIVCYELTVDFAKQIDVRNPKVTDFLPRGVQYVDSTVYGGAHGTTAGVTVASPTVSGQRIDWLVGAVGPDGDRYVPQSGLLVLHVMGRVVQTSPNAAALDKPQNLMKYQQENVLGDVFFLRDASAIQIDSSPTLLKGVRDIDGVPAGGYPFNSNIDNQAVRQGDVVTYRVDVTAPRTDTTGYHVWDALPAGITKADVASFTAATVQKVGAASPVETPLAGGTFTATAVDPGDPGYPSDVAGAYSGRSLVLWNVTATVPGSDPNTSTVRGLTLGYDVTIPNNALVATTYTNLASIVDYQTIGNGPGTTTVVPSGPISTTPAGPGEIAVPGTNTYDDATVATPAASVDKQLVTTEITHSSSPADPNNDVSQAVQGELITYQYSVTVPAHTSVANGVLADRGTLTPGNLPYTVYGTPTWTASALTGAATGDFTLSGSGQLTFPTTYRNSSAVPQVFTVTLVAYLGNLGTNPLTLTNRATFASDSWSGSHDAQVQYIDPSPTIDKSATPSTNLVGGQQVTYTLRATNAANRPLLYGTVVTDCVPAALLNVTLVGGPAGAVVGAQGTSCDIAPGTANGTSIRWTLPTALSPSAPQQIQYTVNLPPTPSGSDTYQNTANLTGTTIPSTFPDAATRAGTRTSTDSQQLQVAAASIAKSVNPTSAPIGATPTYTLDVTLPRDIQFFDTAITDTLPAGVSFGTVTGWTTTGPDPVSQVAVSQAGQVLTWNLGDVPASTGDRTIRITFTATLTNAVAATPVHNTVQLAWNRVNGDSTTRVTKNSSANVTVLNPVLAIDKTVDNQASIVANPAQTFTYRVKVTNTGNTPAFNSVVTDTIPAGVIVSGISDGGTITGQDGTTGGGGTITWNLAGPLNLGDANAKTFTYSGVLIASANLTDANQVNTARVTHFESFPTGGRPYDPTTVQDTATVDPAFPAVTLTKTASGTDPAGADIAYANQPFPWTLTLVNTGQGPAQTISVQDVLPKNWTFDAGSAHIRIGGGATTALADPASSPISGGVQTLTWAANQVSAATPALPGTASGATTAQRTITITFTATPTTAALTDAGVTQAGPPVVHVPHTNTLAATTTDTSGATGNAGGSYTGPNATANAFLDLADLVLNKEAIGGTASTQWVPGQAVGGAYTQPQWRITVHNQGPDAGYGPFSYVDTSTLPAGVTVGAYTARYYSSAADTTGTSLPITGTGTAGDPYLVGSTSTSLKADGSDRIVLVANVTVAASATGTATNTATVTGRTYETNTGNNTDTATQPLTPSADLAMHKTGPATAPNAGDPLAWTLTVTNNGPSDSLSTTAQPITVTDTIPAGMQNATVVTPAGWTASGTTFNAGDTVTFTLGDGLKLTPSQSVQFTVNGTVVAAQPAGTPITNSATVNPGATTDPNPGNNTDDATTTPTTNTTLGIDKTRVVFVGGAWVPAVSQSPVPPVVPGQPVVYQVTVTNTGTADARNVTVTDDLESYLAFSALDSVAPNTWTHTSGTTAPGDPQTFALTGNLAPGASAAFRVTTNLDPGWNAVVTNTAVAHADNSTNDPRDTDDSNSTRDADLKIEKTHTSPVPPASVNAGRSVDYQLTVTNLGPSDSSGPIVVSDKLPLGFTYAAGTARIAVAGAPATTVAPVIGNDGGRVTLTWTVGTSSTSLANGATILVTYTSDIDPTVTAGNYINNAHVDGPDDNNPVNDDATDSVPVTESADLSVVKTAAPGPYVAGQPVTYTVTVTNAGPSVARNVSVVDAAPAGTTVTALSGSGWTCDVPTATCTMPQLGVTSASFTVTASIASNVPTGTALTNVVTVTSSTPDPTTPVTDHATITTTALADLALTKTAVDASGAPITTANAGTQVRYQLKVHNNGPSDAVGPLTIADTLPAGFSYVSIATGGSAWTGVVDPVDAHKVTFTRIAGLAAGADADDLVFIAFIDPAQPTGTSTNTATVSSPTTDPVLPNNTSTAPVTVTQSADLSITKTHDASAVRIGDPLDFTIGVRNAGPSTATGATVVDTIPAGLVYVDAAHSDPAWTVVAAPVAPNGTTTVTATLTGSLAPAGTAPALVLTTTVTAAAYDAVTNTAEVAATQPDPDPANNTTDDHVTVPPQATLVLHKEAVGAFQVGENGQYRLTLTNQGPTEDPGPITITDELPNGLHYVSSDTSGATCSAASRTVTCVVTGPLAVGATVQITLTVAVGYAAYPTVTNTAVVTTPTQQLPDAVLTSSATTTVAAQPLPATGGVLPNLMIALALILFGIGALLLILRRRQNA